MGVFPSNATMIFEQPEGAIHPINEDGDPETTTNRLIVVAYLPLKNRKDITAPQMDRDSDIHTKHMSGRVNYPERMPNTILPGTTADAVLWRVDTGFTLAESFETYEAYMLYLLENEAQILQRGVFQLQADMGSPFGIQAVLGDRLQGTFQTDVQWSEVV